ncbi:hypothetical protein AAFF_G00311680 [Aldrovandia affinis]|uniref:Uncharacterized protein n=1 Tax=Aldrovandia affinis TaxID=143900 RepID=A0AAD7WQI9_9TELE|nr:hypothetical protein AAFF_G00311680 [Aldrovandia affinis]
MILCWGKRKYEEQKETLQHFLSLREKGKIPAYITPEHMKDWIISEGRNIIRERFQRESADQKDSLIQLVWEVNMRLKMQDIYRELGLTTSSSTPLSDQDTQRAALSDLRSSVMAEPRHISIFSRYYFDPDTVVQRAVGEIIQELARLPVTRPHTISEVVVDTITSLFRTVMDDGEEPSNQTESSRLLSGVAVGAIVTVLHDVHAAKCRATQEFRMQYSHSAGAGVVSALHRDLLEQMGSPEALKVALRRKRRALSNTITTAITAAIQNLLTPHDATIPAMQEYDIAMLTNLDVPESRALTNLVPWARF